MGGTVAVTKFDVELFRRLATIDHLNIALTPAQTETLEQAFQSILKNVLAQPSVCDPERAPAGQHTAWAYCHVPNGSTTDMTARIEQQIERFAPGFRDVVLARHAMGPAALEAHNPNLVGGDFTGGAATIAQLVARPTWRTYRTPVPWLFLCSAATPPGGGVHGMCGYHAAQTVLRRVFHA